jgi:tRNA (guanine37-N1)-methyltransferase
VIRIDILTLFPELLAPLAEASILGIAVRRGLVEVGVQDLRAFATDRHRVVDDAPYGGGDGMVLKCEPAVAAVESLLRPGSRLLAMSPRGRRLDQLWLRELAQESHLVLVCGRYAGFDERILEETRAEELSIGDYVLSGGEAAAWVVTEAVARLVPGVLGNPDSVQKDSFSSGLLEHPVYTRPPEFRGRQVPPELLSGNHGEIERFRRKQSIRLTAERRPDLLARFEAELAERSDAEAEQDRRDLREVKHERDRVDRRRHGEE